MMIQLFGLLLIVAAPVFCQGPPKVPKSPCPDVFMYEPPGTEPDRWYGNINLTTDTTLQSLLLNIVIDSKAHILGNWVGEVSTKDNLDYQIESTNTKIMPGVPFPIRFYIKFFPIKTPRLQIIRLHGREICNVNTPRPVIEIYDDMDSTPPTSTSSKSWLEVWPEDTRRDEDEGDVDGVPPNVPLINVTNWQPAPVPSRRPEAGQTDFDFQDDIEDDTPGVIRPIDAVSKNVSQNEITPDNGGNQVIPLSVTASTLTTATERPATESPPRIQPPTINPPIGESPPRTASTIEPPRRFETPVPTAPSRRPEIVNRPPVSNPIPPRGQPTGFGGTNVPTNQGNPPGFVRDPTNSNPGVPFVRDQTNIRPDTAFAMDPLNNKRPDSDSPGAGQNVNRPVQPPVRNPPRNMTALPTSGQWPWHVAIYRSKQSTTTFVCAGTLISPRHVLTVAHCLATLPTDDVDINSLIVFIGNDNVETNRNDQTRYVDTVILHPESNPSIFRNDLAVLVIGGPIAYTRWVRNAVLWPENIASADITGTIGSVVGVVRVDTGVIHDELDLEDLLVVNPNVCTAAAPNYYRYYNAYYTYCAQRNRADTKVRRLLAGSGMVYPYRGGWYLRGIVRLAIWNTEQAFNGRQLPTQYVIFTDVVKHLPWIQQIMVNF